MSFGSKFPRGVMQSEISGLKPDLISNFPGVEAASHSRGHEFSGRLMSSEGFFLGFIELGQLFFKGREEGLS